MVYHFRDFNPSLWGMGGGVHTRHVRLVPHVVTGRKQRTQAKNKNYRTSKGILQWLYFCQLLSKSPK